VTIGIAMLAARYAAIVPTLALAGAFAARPRNDATTGTLQTDSVVFTLLLVVTIVIVGALTFLPADALGPIVEELLMQRGTKY